MCFMKNNPRALLGTRPYPSKELLDSLWGGVEPSPELKEWVNATILADDGPIHNPDHSHLIDADLCFLWASTAFTKQGRTVLGQCEQVMFRAGGWQKARQEQQMREWFGHVPQFIITLAADYCSQCSDIEFCALVEHELMHIGQQIDEFGSPKFDKEGFPKLCMVGHDVEEFIGVVQRYGASQDVQRLIDAAKAGPSVARANIAHACGTCLRVAA